MVPLSIYIVYGLQQRELFHYKQDMLSSLMVIFLFFSVKDFQLMDTQKEVATILDTMQHMFVDSEREGEREREREKEKDERSAQCCLNLTQKSLSGKRDFYNCLVRGERVSL